jgi:hypothetical protein
MRHPVETDGGGSPLGLIVSTKFAKDHGLAAATPAAQVAKQRSAR